MFSGCTVHWVTPEIDAGPIIAQAVVPIMDTDTEADLSARILEAEHRLYPVAINANPEWFSARPRLLELTEL
jgi:phosphoribosylglycinamide formyltransferase-1